MSDSDQSRICRHDIDTPSGLIARHCPERTVLLSTDDAGAEERFLALQGVRDVSLVDGRLTIRGTGDGLVTQVIQFLAEHRIRVTDFRTVLPTLEDVFLGLTGHSIRD